MEDPLGLSSRFQILAIKQFFYVRMALNGRSLSERGTRTRPMFIGKGVVCGSAWFKLLNTAQHPATNVSPDPKLLKNESENKGQYFGTQHDAWKWQDIQK